MKFSDLLYISFQNFKNRKSRVFFTILGVAVAIAVVLSLVSFGYGLQNNLLNQITTQEALQTLDVSPSDSKVIVLDQSAIGQISTMPKVVAVSPEAVIPGQLSYNKTISETSINLIDANFFGLAGKSPTAGRFLASGDAKKVVISSTVANLFNLAGNTAIGKTIQLVAYIPDEKKPLVTNDVQLGGDFEIVGVVDDSSASGDVYVLKDTVPMISVTTYQYAKVKVASTNDMETVRESLINKGFVVSSLSDIVRQANEIFSIVQISLGIFGIFALIVAAIGLVNTMTISLLERTNEIGIMRAIGATPLDIKKIFIGESIIIGFLGGLSGIIFGIVGSQVLNWLFNLLVAALGGHGTSLFSYPVWFIFFIIGISTLVGFIGGIWPAYRAGNLNPLQALRYK